MRRSCGGGERYPPISDYAFISDCDNVALISRTGSIDWCCMPRIDADSCFGRILDWDKGGCFELQPTAERFDVERSYEPGTLILTTRFSTSTGSVELTDFFSLNKEHEHRDHLFRIVTGMSGSVEMALHCEPRFDYGDVAPFISEFEPRHGQQCFSIIGSNKALILYSDRALTIADDAALEGTFMVEAGESCHVSLWFVSPEHADRQRALRDKHPRADHELRHSRRWWRNWSQRTAEPYRDDPQTLCSAVVLKGLTYEATGAVAAAPTTSLPEWIGGERNWDYRYSWVRDSVFTVRVLYQLGFRQEGDRFCRFIERSSAGSARHVQVMYAVDGKRRLPEQTLDWLEGYRGSRPVRIGNGAAHQTQLDLYGELLLLSWLGHEAGHELAPSYRRFLHDIVEVVCERWQQPDRGIWEIRGEERHFVYSKALCWAAVDVGIRFAEAYDGEVPSHWPAARDEIRQTVDGQGFDAARGTYRQAFGSSHVDAALLRLPLVGFVRYDDERMLGTVQAIRDELEEEGLIHRYIDDDGLPGEEGAFIACTFWLVNCLARQGELALAERYYARALSCANDLGLFPEEVDPQRGTALGNFPQGLTHVAQITARIALEECRGGSSGATPAPHPDIQSSAGGEA